MVRWMAANLVEFACLGLMVVLSVDVLLGVFSRYVLVRTFTWYDEVARACFVWLVFLGAAVGVKRQAHFRLRLIVERLSSRQQQSAELLGSLVVVVVAAILIWQGWVLVELGLYQQLPVMGISKAWVYAAIPLSGALMVAYTLGPAGRALKRLTARSGAAHARRPAEER